jgi:hypothetical protein
MLITPRIMDTATRLNQTDVRIIIYYYTIALEKTDPVPQGPQSIVMFPLFAAMFRAFISWKHVSWQLVEDSCLRVL